MGAVIAAVVAWFLVLAAPLCAAAQQHIPTPGSELPISTETIVVTATRWPQPLSETAAAVSAVEQSDIQGARKTASLDEPLNRVPGVFAQNSDNFAQDVRLQIRGFGTRATFGIREIKVLVDGLPLTMADGQTELDGIDLGAIERIEVLRGTASSLYGNASGGVIQLFTEDGPETPAAQARLTGGSFGLGKYEVKGGGQTGDARLFVHSSFLQLDGYREYGAGRRGTVYGKLQYSIDDATDLSVILNGADTPVADDPGGLTRQEADDDPRQANPLHTQLDAGEDVQQGRAGVVARHRMAAGELSAYTYLLYRDFQNRLPIPPARPAVQGGIVAFHRFSPGGGVRYLLAAPLLGWAQQLTLGIDAQHQDDERRRFQNAYGQRGALGLHQHEQVTSAGPYVREAISLRDDIEVNAGARYDTVHFAVDVDTPPDSSSSGSRTLEHWSPAGGVRYAARPWLSLFAGAGTAFQVPGTTEFANPAGAGFNPDLGPQTATSYELGARAQLDRLYAGIAAFYIDIRDELVPYELASQPGRTFFRNAGHSRRYGLEIDWQATLLPELRWTSAVTLIRAEYVDYATPQGRFDGNHEPGIPPWQIYQELAYRHRSGLFAAFEMFAVDHYAVDDANMAFSRSYVLCNLRAGYDRRLGNWTLAPFVGLDNLTGAAYDGRVRTNAAGGRFFEPAPGFNVYGGLAVTARM